MTTTMKQTIAILSLLMISVSCWAKKTVVWSQPSCLYISASYFSVRSVAFSDTATVVTLQTNHAQNSVRFSHATFLRADDGRHYAVRYCKEYALDEWMPVDRQSESVVTLVFEPIKGRQRALDLLEGYAVNDFKFFGIHDASKPMKLQPFPYESKEVKDFRASFFTSDSVCIRGRFEVLPADRVGTIEHRDIFSGRDFPLAVTVNDDGTFERRFKVDHPVAYSLYFEQTSIPFIALPGMTVNILVNENGEVDYTVGEGRPHPFARLLQHGFHDLTSYDYRAFREDTKQLDFKAFAQKMERVAQTDVRLLDYLARRYELSPLEYAVAKTSALLGAACHFLDFEMMVRDSRTDSVLQAQMNEPENYRLLKQLIVDDRLVLMFQRYDIFQNRYSYMDLIMKSAWKVDEGGVYAERSHAEADSMALSLDRNMFGQDEPSVLVKVHLLNVLQQRLNESVTVAYANDNTAVDKEKIRAQLDREAEDAYRLTKSELTEPFYQKMADKIYQHYLDTKDFTYCLPMNQATLILRKITDRFKGKYVFLDFWSTGCGPCRSNIEGTSSARARLRQNPEVAFVFITNDYQSPEKPYQEYVAKHLKDDYTYRLPRADYELLRELFQFNGIPHYEVLDKQGNVVRIDGHWFSEEYFNNKLKMIKQRLE